jgi:hypothetical protein
MKQRLIILGMWVLVLTTLSSFLAPLRASAAVPAGIDGTMVFADGEANAHEGAPGFALAWVEHAFNVSGVPTGAASAWTYYVALGKPNDGANPEGVPRGALVFFSGSGGDGHVGIALGDGQMISDLNIPGIKTGVYKGPLSEGGTLAGWAWPPADWPGRPELAGTSNVFVPTIPIPPLATAALAATKLAAALPTTAVKPAVALPRATTTTTPRAATATTTPRYGTTTTTPLLTTTSTTLNVTPVGTGERLTATVSPSAATGSVQFTDNGTNIGSAVVSGGTASITTTLQPAGIHSLTAVFTPSTTAYRSSTSNTVPYTVSPAPAPAPTTTTTTTPAQPALQQQTAQQQALQQQAAQQQQTQQQQAAQRQAQQQQAAQQQAQQAAQLQALQQQAQQQQTQQQQAAQRQAQQQQAAQQQAQQAAQLQALQQQAQQQQTQQQQAAQQQALEQQAAQQSAPQQSRSRGR